MIFGFAFLLSAPLLRLGWTSIMALAPSVGLPMANLYVSSLIFPVCTMIALVPVGLTPGRTSPGLAAGGWVPRAVLPLCAVLGALGYGALGLISFTWDSEWAPRSSPRSVGLLIAAALIALTGLDDRQGVMAGVGVAPGITSFGAFLRADQMIRRGQLAASPPVRVGERTRAARSPNVG